MQELSANESHGALPGLIEVSGSRTAMIVPVGSTVGTYLKIRVLEQPEVWLTIYCRLVGTNL